MKHSLRTLLLGALTALSLAAAATAPEPSSGVSSGTDAGRADDGSPPDGGAPMPLNLNEFRPPPWGRYPPECGTIVGFGEGMAHGLARLTDAFIGVAVPTVGVRAERQRHTLAASLGLPLTWTFGPVTHTSVERWTCGELHDDFQPNRLTLEPSVIIGAHPAFLLRPAYRFVWHPNDQFVGAGLGLGSTVEFSALPARMSASPELFLHLGHCCGPGYGTVTLRYDRFFAPTADTLSLLVGTSLH